MSIIGGRLAFAAYLASISLRTSTAFSALTHFPLTLTLSDGSARRTIPSIVTMSASTSSDAEMKVDLASNIALVRQRMDDAISSNELPAGSVRLVAVSKTKPLELLQAAYEVIA